MRSKLVLLALSLTVSLPTMCSRAEGAAQVSIFRQTGDAAIASFESLDETGCVITDTFIFGSADDLLVPPDGGPIPGTVVGVSVSKFDQCRGAFLLVGLGSSSDVNYQIARDLSSATVNGTFLLDDINSGTTLSVTVNMAWTGAGDISHQIANGHVRVPGFVETNHFNGDTRDGTATGIISGNGENFTPRASLSAQLERSAEGQVSLQTTK